MSSVLHLKYRPKSFDEVIGQDRAVNSLKKVLAADTAHSFLFSGPSGTGKTTLARICAAQVGCKPHDITEINAAKYTGVDSARELEDGLQYKPFHAGNKAVILDESHMLSKAAFNSLLKILEEPPSYVYWFLCTTEPGKIPAAVKTRCLSYDLQSVSTEDLRTLLDKIVLAEKLKTPSEILAVVASEAGGSPRQALVNLAVVGACKTRAEAAPLLRSAEESPEVVDLCRGLIKGFRWDELREITSKFAPDVNAESVRIVVCNYVAAVLKNARGKDAVNYIKILDAFSHPFNQSEKMAPLYLAIGRVCFAE